MVTDKKEKSMRLRKHNRWGWLDDAAAHEKQGFTFPQVKPSLLFFETPASLASKVPIVPGPNNVVVLATTRIGTKRFQVPPDAEFDLSQPYRPLPGYNFLHDPHLNEYLNNPLVKKRLQEKGLVTKGGFVKCTIKEFNDYRQWIRKLKLDALEQDWHLQTSNQLNNEKSSKNHEATQLTRQRQERAKELYNQKQKKKEHARRRYLKFMEEKEAFIEDMKRNQARQYEQRRQRRNSERDRKLMVHEEQEKEVRKIRFRILFDSKESIKKREERVNTLYREKLAEKEKKAEEMWKRKQSYCMKKMNEENDCKEEEMQKRRQSIQRRESVYQKERRKSDVLMMQHIKENRDNALRHLEEAGRFVDMIEVKKEKEIKKWRKKLQSIEERENLLNHYRQKNNYDENAGKYRRRHSNSRQSAWDIDKVLLKHIMEDLSECERKELGCASSQNEIDLIDTEEKETPHQHLQIGLDEKQPSFVTFDKIYVDDTIDVYKQTGRSAEGIEASGHNMLDIPGLVIQHTKSVHHHLPCVFELNEDKKEMEHDQEEVIQLDEVMHEMEGQKSSYEILIIPSRTSCIEEETGVADNNRSEKMPLVHVISEIPVMVSKSKISYISLQLEESESQKIALAAKSIVQVSLANAAKDLGYSNEAIIDKIGIKLTEKGTISASRSEEIQQTAKQITDLALIKAAVSIGFDKNEISNALGMDESSTLLDVIEGEYNSHLKQMLTHAIHNAALDLGYNYEDVSLVGDTTLPMQSTNEYIVKKLVADTIHNAAVDLGYTQEEISKVLGDNTSSTDDLSFSTSTITGKTLAKSTMSKAAKQMGFEKQLSEGSFVKEDCLLPYDSFSLNQEDETRKIIVHNALRNAALSLGYSEENVASTIGPEKETNNEVKMEKLEKQLVGRVSDNSAVMSRRSEGESELMLKRYSTVPSEVSVELQSLEGSETVMSRSMSESANYNATGELGFSQEEIVSSMSSPGDSDTEKLQSIAGDIVNQVIQKSSMIVQEEQKSLHKINAEEKRLKSFALKFSMAIIGSAGKMLGYEDRNIIAALSKNTRRMSNRKYSEKHPNFFVKFDQKGIGETLRECSDIVDQQNRRQSIKDRAATPKFTSFTDIDDEDDNDNVGNETYDMKRRLTPYFPESVEKKLLEEYNKSTKPNETIIIEEDDEEEGSGSSKQNLEEKWSTNFIKKLESFHNDVDLETNRDYSELSEAEIMDKVAKESREDYMGRQQLVEYPNEFDFINFAFQTNNSGTDDHNLRRKQEAELMGMFGHNKLAPGLLDLYSSIQSDVLKMLSNTNLAFLHSFHLTSQLRATPEFTPNLMTPSFVSEKVIGHTDGAVSPGSVIVNPNPSNLALVARSLELSKSLNNVSTLASPPARLSPNVSFHACQSSRTPSLPKIESTTLSVCSKEQLTAQASSIDSLPRVNTSSVVSVVTLHQKLSEKEDVLNGEKEVVLINKEDSRNEVLTLGENESVKSIVDDVASNVVASQKRSITTKHTFPEKEDRTIKHIPDRYSSHTASVPKNKSSNIVPIEYRTRALTTSHHIANVDSKTSTPSYAKPLNRSSMKVDSDVRRSSTFLVGKRKNDSGSSVFERLAAQHSSKTLWKEAPIKQNSLKSIVDRSSSRSLNPIPPRNSSIVISDKEKVLPRRSLRKSSLIVHKIKEKSTSSTTNEVVSQNSAATTSIKEHGSIKKSPPKKSTSSENQNTFAPNIGRISSKANVKSKPDSAHHSTHPTHQPTPPKRSKKEMSRSSLRRSMASTSTAQISSVSLKKLASKPSSHENPSSFIKTKKASSTQLVVNTKNSSLLKSRRSRRKSKNSLKKSKSSMHVMQIDDQTDSLSNIDKEIEEVISASLSLLSDDTTLEVIDETVERKKQPQSTVDKNSDSCDRNLSIRKVPVEDIRSTKKKLNDSWEMVELQDVQEEQHNVSSKHAVKDTETNPSYVQEKKQRSDNKSDCISSKTCEKDRNDYKQKVELNANVSKQSIPSSLPSTVSLKFDRTLDAKKIGNAPNKSNQNIIRVKPSTDNLNSSNSLVKTTSKVRSSSGISFVPSPPPGKLASTILMSQSLKSMTNNGARRPVSKSRSLGSAGRIMPTDSRHRHYSSSYRESVPMTPLEENNYQDFNELSRRASSFNRRSAKSSSMWIPAQSIHPDHDDVEPELHSSDTVLVQAAPPSRQQSATSFKSGHIFVTPVASINFASSIPNDGNKQRKTPSITSVNEVVEKQVSGTELLPDNISQLNKSRD